MSFRIPHPCLCGRFDFPRPWFRRRCGLIRSRWRAILDLEVSMDVFDVRSAIGIGGGNPPGPVIATCAGSFERAVDGDTWVIAADSPLLWWAPVVRLKGVDCPELGGPEDSRAREAKDAVEALILGQTVAAWFYGQDLYGRCVGEVYPMFQPSVSSWLIAHGLGSPILDSFSLPYFSRELPASPWVGRRGVCSEVLDGDTVRVALAEPLYYYSPTIRGARIDCPELQGRYAGTASKALLLAGSLGAGRRVSCDIYGADVYGRVVSDVSIAGSGDLGGALIAAGFACWYPPAFGPDLFPGEVSKLRVRLG